MERSHLLLVILSINFKSWLTSNKEEEHDDRASSRHSTDGRSRWLVGSSTATIPVQPIVRSVEKPEIRFFDDEL